MKNIGKIMVDYGNTKIDENTTYACMSTHGECESYMPMSPEIEQLKIDGKIDEYLANKFTDEDLFAIQAKYDLGMNHIHRAAVKTEKEGEYKPNGEICYNPIKGPEATEQLIDDLDETWIEWLLGNSDKSCVSILENIGSKNVKQKCETLIETIKNSQKEDGMGTKEIAILIAIFVFGGPLASKVIDRIWPDKPNGGSSSGSSSKSSPIIIPNAKEIRTYSRQYSVATPSATSVVDTAVKTGFATVVGAILYKVVAKYSNPAIIIMSLFMPIDEMFDIFMETFACPVGQKYNAYTDQCTTDII